ncbi:Flowering-promoting factor 1-like protein 1 [Ananas comosus]|uniref:Flowering-promoting factor 1-like protein 1 n=1 Tax=Ananas comosus TaxID=4615 RepID=A0A199V3Q2_ANACO|nr:Flowering-promoting factor 1-like protein 1 [Ananas comosus]
MAWHQELLHEFSSTILCGIRAYVERPSSVINSYASLESKLRARVERYYDDLDLLQFHKPSSIDLISLPKDFSQFKSMHMYDIVLKNRESFRVIDIFLRRESSSLKPMALFDRS